MATVLHIDATTNTVTERDETLAEAAARADLHAQRETNIVAAAAQVSARNSALTKLKVLGLTDAEVAALVGG